MGRKTDSALVTDTPAQPHPLGFPPLTLERFRNIGRHTILCPQVIADVTEFILRGNYILTSCLAAGIARQTYHHWMGIAADEIEEGKTEAESELIRFLVSCEKARAQAELYLTDRVMTRDAFWQRWAWMLERTRPQSYGPRQQIDVTQDVTITSVSLPPPTQDYSTWLSQRLTTDTALKSLPHKPLDIIDADIVDDKDQLVRVDLGQERPKLLSERYFSGKRRKE